MTAEQSRNELTTTLHLGLREVTDSASALLEDRLASLSPEDRAVIAQIQDSQGEKALIFIARGANKGSRFLVTSEGTTIGRNPSSGIFLDDVTVSRSHATITKVDKGFVLRDTGSLNGTYMNNVAITEHPLVSGDEFQVGKFHLIFIGSTNKNI